MALKSMTGFARADGASGDAQWHWEVKSVNGRALDLRTRLPNGCEGLEPRIRDAVARRLVRGNVNVSLSLQRQAAVAIRLNEAVLAEVLKAVDRIQHLTGCERPRAEGLLGLKGVIEVSEAEEDEASAEARAVQMLQSLELALDGLAASRAGEGARLAAILAGQLDEIARLTDRIEVLPARSPEAVKRRLQDQVARLFEAANALDPQRLHQEAMLLATRADVAEELARLKAHVAAARDLMADNGAVGRKLDFLAQEFNREANTLCSKSNDGEMTRLGLDLKAVIEQMREQVQNIE